MGAAFVFLAADEQQNLALTRNNSCIGQLQKATVASVSYSGMVRKNECRGPRNQTLTSAEGPVLKVWVESRGFCSGVLANQFSACNHQH